MRFCCISWGTMGAGAMLAGGKGAAAMAVGEG